MKMLLIALAAAALAGSLAPAHADPAASQKPACDALCQEFLAALYRAEDAAAEYRQEIEAKGGRAPEQTYKPHHAMPVQEAANTISGGNAEVAANAAGGM